ncbi:methyltransferase domain-containing protein [Actinoplanes couchii]|uniref:Trans-aconitate 2-methyltransferase n=1 Tax=Actinoplanes couchii TaxID=403638 RepID=A0ABQ3X4D4_9ACTN|nr:methyltransferase domain-containing protein [Actinoplanes couchii]MDR6326268.1 trans-aconitate 2-methyltransferase [Actinoplanes couchii]GID53380.1 trans-aconitate 2-methyltransferase [Actinoplanes couchii]
MWDPAVYGRFGAERSRPFFDLVTRIGAENPRAVVDLGCGPGDLTRTLADRWPGARVTGIDSSPEMIAKAGDGFRLGDIADWSPEPDVDVLVTNAALQWVPGHQEMLARWVTELPAGAWLAMQVPGNFDSPGHRAARELSPIELRADPVSDAAGYAGLLTGAGATVDAWETTYLHLLPVVEGAEHPVLRWMEGTALRPVRAALDDGAWTAFRAAFAERIAEEYPERHGLVAFPFRRIFVVASI